MENKKSESRCTGLEPVGGFLIFQCRGLLISGIPIFELVSGHIQAVVLNGLDVVRAFFETTSETKQHRAGGIYGHVLKLDTLET